MAQMQRFVRIRRRILHHHGLCVFIGFHITVIGCRIRFFKLVYEYVLRQFYVKKTFDNIEILHNRRDAFFKRGAYLARRILRAFVRCPDIRKCQQRQVAGKFRSRGLKVGTLVFQSVNIRQHGGYIFFQNCLYVHILFFFS